MDVESDAPEASASLDLAEAVALMEGAEEAATGSDAVALATPDAPATAPPASAPDAAAEEEAFDQAPAFWSAEDKERWQEVPQTLRPVLHRYERQRAAVLHEKRREAATARDEALRMARAAGQTVEQAAAWWERNGPALHKAFADKWSTVDWKALAEKDPEGVQRMMQQRQEDETLLADAERRGQAHIAAAREKAEQDLRAARQAEHAKLAERLPDYFAPDRAQQTYEALGRFLYTKGIPAERIAAIYEAPVIELALSAMRFENAQRALREAAGTKQQVPAKPTPTRIAPGPAARLDNRAGEAARQVSERFRQSGGTSIADAAELIRLNEL
ncbi:MAG: hypothetical protein ACOY4R_31440 [Pseudomonadota bacterium]